jgi:hypothetical protein
MRPWPVVSAVPSRARTLAVQIALPGIGGRYLRRIAEAAAATGWEIEHLAALVGELERRCGYVLAAPSPNPLTGGGRRGVPGAVDALAWHAGRWARPGGSRTPFTAILHQGRARGDVVSLAASGGRLPRAMRGVLAALAADVSGSQTTRSGVARELGLRWALEAFACPRITADHLAALRDRFAGAPRCDWCGVPVLGRSCRRCVPGEPA